MPSPTPTRIVLLAISACLWCALLLGMRQTWSGQPWYLFLAWNLFLAAIPLALSMLLSFVQTSLLALPLMMTWLLFFPNAPYVLTDLIHLRERGGVPIWYDLIMLLSFAFVALWMGFQSMRQVQEWVLWRTASKRFSWIFVFTSLMLSGFGIYLGRFQRWNSWDIVTRPRLLLADISQCLTDPAAFSKVWGVTFGFGGMLVVSYIIWTSTHPVPVNSTPLLSPSDSRD